MAIPSRTWKTPVVALVLIAAAVMSCGKDGSGKPQSPLAPTPTPTPTPASVLVRLELNAPASVAPGTPTPLVVNAIKSDGAVENVTASAQWLSSDSRIISVDTSGVARATSTGEVTITARYQNRSAGTLLIAVPAGTFRVKGQITDAGLGVSAVTVTVVRGVGEGLTTTTNTNGGYALYGVRDHVVLQAKRDGYLNRIEELDVSQNRLYDFPIVLEGIRTDVRGRYSLTLTRMPCTGNVPDVRTYDATIDQVDRRLTVTLSGADFIVSRGHGNTFTGTLDGDRVQFVLSSADTYYGYYYYGQYDVIERLDSTRAFIVSGNVTATATPTSIAGTMNGTFLVAQGAAPPFTRILNQCSGASHRFEMTRR